jgi:cysteinyl-tRNA synthetase
MLTRPKILDCIGTHLHYHEPKRQIVIGVKSNLHMAKDSEVVRQSLLINGPNIKIVETYRIFNTFRDTETCIDYLKGYGEVVHQTDVIVNLPEKKNLEDELVRLLVDLYLQAKEKKDLTASDQIKNKLQSIGVVLIARKDSDIFWNANGLIK